MSDTDAVVSAQSFSLFPVALTVMHHYVTRLHIMAADWCCALAAAHLGPDGLRGKHGFDAGAGFGGSMNRALLAGAQKMYGMEREREQISMAGCLAGCSFAAVDTPLMQRLYPPSTIEAVLGAINHEQTMVKALRKTVRNPQGHHGMLFKVGDVLTMEATETLRGTPCDFMIGNIMLHWLTRRGVGIGTGLNKLAQFVKPGGIAVFNVLYHFLELEDPEEDERLRTHCLFDTPFYRRFAQVLYQELVQKFAGVQLPPVGSMRKMQPLLLRDADLCAGSEELELIQRVPVFMGPLDVYMPTIIRSLGAMEAAVLTQRPVDEQIVDVVLTALVEACDGCREIAPGGTYAFYYVYRRRS